VSSLLKLGLMKPGAWRSLKQWREGAGDRLNLFFWVWIIVPVVFFSFFRSKLPGYILPLFSAVAVVVGKELNRWWIGVSSRLTVQSLLTTALIAVAGIVSGVMLQGELGVDTRDAWLMGLVAILIAAVYLGLLVFKNGRVATLYLPFGLAMI